MQLICGQPVFELQSVVNPYYGIETEYRARSSGEDLVKWFSKPDREYTKQEQLRKTISGIKESVTGQEAKLLALNIYDRIYHDVVDNKNEFDTNILYDGVVNIHDLNKPYLEKYARLSLDKYFNNFAEFMAMSRSNMNTFLETMHVVSEAEAKNKNSGEKAGIKEAMKSLQNLK